MLLTGPGGASNLNALGLASEVAVIRPITADQTAGISRSELSEENVARVWTGPWTVDGVA